MSINAIIIDDEQLSIDVLEWEIEGLSHSLEIIGKTTNPLEGLEMLRKLDVDLVFLDIEMPKMSGLELLSQIEKIDFNIIFTTAYDQYALEAIKNEALDYLLKPVQKEELQKAIEKHLTRASADVERSVQNIFSKLMKGQKTEKIVIPTSEGLEFIRISEILRCESSSNYTYIHNRDKSKMLVSKTLKDIEALLPAETFKRIHKSHLININCIERYLKSDGGIIVMEDSSEVPISRNKKGAFLGQF